MVCEDLSRDTCPCVLADIGQCRCCSLLMGKEFCNCDYPGVCIYEKHRWEEKQPLEGGNQVIAIEPHATGTGIILQLEATDKLSIGKTVVLQHKTYDPISAVVLRVYNSHLVYVVTFSNCGFLTVGASICIEPGLNVFGNDAASLDVVNGQSVLILADVDLVPLLPALAAGLKEKGATVQLLALNENWTEKSADLLLFASQNQAALRHALKRLPLLRKVRSAFWFVE